MAHPSDYLGNGGIIVIDEDQGAVSAPSGKIICAITNTDVLAGAGTFTVKGSGIYQYLGASNAAATSHIDPTTGVAFTAADNDAGYYEALDTVAVTIEITPGSTVYGRFTEVDATTTDAAVLYLA
jgi:hypothetical protein